MVKCRKKPVLFRVGSYIVDILESLYISRYRRHRYTGFRYSIPRMAAVLDDRVTALALRPFRRCF